MIHRFTLLFVLLAPLTRAVTVLPPVERTITDEFERTMEVRVVGVTSDSLEFVRIADNARFTVPLGKLSKADQTFAGALLKKIERSRPLPDTPLIKAVRRDFQVFDAEKKRLVPLAADAYQGEPILVVAFTYLHEPSRAFEGGMRNQNPVADQAPVLWILLSGEPALFALASEKLPKDHAMISYDARQKALSQGDGVYQDYFTGWYSRNFKGEGPAPQFNPSEKERAELTGKLARAMPPYWVDVSATFYLGNRGSRSYPQFIAVRRDGSPVKFRGADLTGSRQVVMQVLRDHSAELQ